MTEFTPFSALSGGALIGLAAVVLMGLLGRIAGMTGILTGLFYGSDRDWRSAFLLGAILAPVLMITAGVPLEFETPVPRWWLLPGGILVGIGVTLGGGCTSGHGVCGNARLSRRSIAATLIFMASAVATVFIIRHLFGGL